MNTSVCVCLCVCLSVHLDISANTRAIFTEFSVHVAYGRIARSSSGRVRKFEGEGTVLGVFFPTDNAL